MALLHSDWYATESGRCTLIAWQGKALGPWLHLLAEERFHNSFLMLG